MSADRDTRWWQWIRPEVARDMPDLLPRLDAAYAAGGSARAEMRKLLEEHNLDINRITIRTLHLRVSLAYAQQLGDAGVVELARRTGLSVRDEPSEGASDGDLR